MDPKVTDSAARIGAANHRAMMDTVCSGLSVTVSIPQPVDECAVAFQQFRPEATRRLAGYAKRTDGRGMEPEIVTVTGHQFRLGDHHKMMM